MPQPTSSAHPAPPSAPGSGEGSSDRARRADGRPENARPRDRTGRPLAHDTDETALAVELDPATVEEALALGMQRWQQQRFFEAHELLEHVWHWSIDDKAFWQGVIQVAAAFVHHQRGNPLGVVKTIDKAAPKLQGVPDDHHGIDVVGLRAWCTTTRAALVDDPDAPVPVPVVAADPGQVFLERGRADTALERRGAAHRGTIPAAGHRT